MDMLNGRVREDVCENLPHKAANHLSGNADGGVKKIISGTVKDAKTSCDGKKEDDSPWDSPSDSEEDVCENLPHKAANHLSGNADGGVKKIISGTVKDVKTSCEGKEENDSSWDLPSESEENICENPPQKPVAHLSGNAALHGKKTSGPVEGKTSRVGLQEEDRDFSEDLKPIYRPLFMDISTRKSPEKFPVQLLNISSSESDESISASPVLAKSLVADGHHLPRKSPNICPVEPHKPTAIRYLAWGEEEKVGTKSRVEKSNSKCHQAAPKDGIVPSTDHGNAKEKKVIRKENKDVDKFQKKTSKKKDKECEGENMTKKKNADEDQAGKKGGSGMAFLQRVNSVFSKNQPKSQRKHPNAQSVGMSTPEKEAMSSTQRGEPGRTTDEWNAHHVPKPCVSEESSKVVEDPETHGRMELQKTKYDAPAVDYRLIHPTKNGGTANQTFIPFETGDSALFLRNSSKKKHMDPGTSATTRDIFHMISKLQDENATLKHEMDTVKYQYEMLKHHNDILERKYHQEVTTKIRDIEHLVTTVKEVTEEEKRNDTGSPATLSNILDTNQKLNDEIATLKQDMEKMRQENLMPKEDKDRQERKDSQQDTDSPASLSNILHTSQKVNNEIATLKQDMETMQHDYVMLKQDMDRLERKENEVRTTVQYMEHQTVKLKEVREEVVRNDTGSPATLSNILDIIQKLKDEIVTLKQDMEKMRQENLMPKEDKDRQERKDSQQDTGNPTTVRNILHTIQNLKDEIATLNQHMERLQHKFLVQKQDIDRLERKENEGRTTVRYTKHETIKVKEVREEVLRNDTDSPSSQNNILHTIQKLKDEIASLKQDMEILQQENLMLKQDMNRQERKDSQQDTGSPATLSNILHTSQKLKDEIATLKRDMKTMQHDYVMLKQDMDRQERKDNQKVSATIGHMEHQRTSVKEVREELLRNDTVSPATLRNILDTNQKLQDENATLKRDIDTMQNEYVMLKEDIDRLGKKAYQHDSDSHEKSRERFHEIQELQDEIATIKQLLDIVKHHYKMRMQMLKQNKDRLKTSHHEMKSEDIK